MNGAICEWSLRSVRDAIAGGDISPVDVVEAVLARIAARAEINAYISVMGDSAIAAARQCERALLRGDRLGPLFGVPIALKDNIATAGVLTTAGSPLREQWIPDEDAAAVRALLAAGAIIIGKNNLYEFAFGAAHPRFGETLNPWNSELSCGGSSSGSAAAVADGQCFASVGTDTGGSIRIPAAMCGVVGLKITNGSISNRGVIPVSPALDVVGPMTRSVDDAELMLLGMGHTPPLPDGNAVQRTVTVGVPSGLEAGTPIDPKVDAALKLAARRLEEEGFALREVTLPDLSLALDVMWLIASADAAAYHRSELNARSDDYCEEVRRNLVGGALVPAVDYIRAQQLRRRIREEMDALFALVDAILLPAIPITPYPSGSQTIRIRGVDEPVLPMVMAYTPLANLTGHPAIVVPVDTPGDGPPTTIQLYGRRGREDLLLRVARAVEATGITLPR